MLGELNCGGSSSTFAFIVVTYPVGSVCTCSDGIKTLRAKDTSGSFVFHIPYAGTWTVSITDGTETKTKSANITYFGQSELIAMFYYLHLYDGQTQTDVNLFGRVTGNANISYNSSTFAMTARFYAADIFYRNQIVQIDDYTQLSMRVTRDTATAMYVVICDTSFNVIQSVAVSSGTATYTMPITATGNCYIAYQATSNTSRVQSIYDIMLT